MTTQEAVITKKPEWLVIKKTGELKTRLSLQVCLLSSHTTGDAQRTVVASTLFKRAQGVCEEAQHGVSASVPSTSSLSALWALSVCLLYLLLHFAVPSLFTFFFIVLPLLSRLSALILIAISAAWYILVACQSKCNHFFRKDQLFYALYPEDQTKQSMKHLYFTFFSSV